jgi:uncharacterized protein YndB with AHSA1/START domain
MNDERVKRATGRSRPEWFAAIREAGKAEAPHKEIADFLHAVHDVSSWWAQEITVEFEKHIGRRVIGQTQDGLFQIGVSKTIAAPAEKVWECLQSPWGIGLIVAAADHSESAPEDDSASAQEPAAARAAGEDDSFPRHLQSLEHLEGQSRSGVCVSTTTFEHGSHVRMRWQSPDWPEHSILQVRLMPKDESKTVLSFHQEKLPSQEARAQMREHWARVAAAIAASLKAPGSTSM